MNFKYLYVALIISNLIFLRWNDEPEYSDLDFECDLDGDLVYDCKEFYEYGVQNFQQKDYRASIDQFKLLLKCGCKAQLNEKVYKRLGSGYLEINLDKIIRLDSSLFYVKLGLQNYPDDIQLLELAAWISNKQFENGDLDKLNEQLYYLDEILSIDPKNTNILEQINATFKNNNMFEEQIIILDKWLELDPTNKKAIADKKNAFNELGLDETDVDRERWETDKNNLQYGISYINSLLNNYEEDIALEISLILYKRHSKDKKLLRIISDIYLNLYEDENAIIYLEELIELDTEDSQAMIDLSNAYINISEFKRSYLWADNAIKVGKKLGDAYFQRAQVLMSLVESYESIDLNFCDRLIYDLASEDFEFAFKNGNVSSKQYKEGLEEYVTSAADWFLSGIKENQISPSNSLCEDKKQSDCYSWVKRSVKRKN